MATNEMKGSHFRRATTVGLVGAAVLLAGCVDRPIATTKPVTTNVFVTKIDNSAINKIDLLFSIDNSRSMADKQALVKEAVPLLVSRLITPDCVQDGKPVDRVDGECPAPSEPEFTPIGDIHIGVISSSMGAYGGQQCSPAIGEKFHFSMVDNGHLLNRTEESLQTGTPAAIAGVGNFLDWNPGGGGLNDAETLKTQFSAVISGVGEYGCGFEMALESWYHFLVDPFPWLEIKTAAVDNEIPGAKKGMAYPSGVDQALLDQRAEFLRPDSLVAIIMVTDEDDCSTIDSYYGNAVQAETLWLYGTSACATNPNDKCCRPCGAERDGCSAWASDPACQTANQVAHPNNHRCWDQKRRLGIDLLQPVQRYVDGLKNLKLEVRDPNDLTKTVEVTNPLYSRNEVYPDSNPRADSGLVFLAGIVGVPWQDIATEESLAAGTTALKYQTAKEIDWANIIPGVDGSKPKDPFMIQANGNPKEVGARSGTNPRLKSASITGPGTRNEINGWDWGAQQASSGDLEYACIYKLETPRDCTAPEYNSESKTEKGCDCKASKTDTAAPYGRPLCEGNEQQYAKAYPGTRVLQVLNGYNENSIVASICPKNPILSDATVDDRDLGYNPAVGAIIDRLKEKLSGACLPRSLAVEDGAPACLVVEATYNQNVVCTSEGREPLDSVYRKGVESELEKSGKCGGETGRACKDMVVCELPQAEGSKDDESTPLGACMNLPTAPVGVGWCYIDKDIEGQGNPALVAPPTCSLSQPRQLRFLENPTLPSPVPANQATIMIACQGKALDQ